MTGEIVIIGAGGHGRVCAEVAQDAGFHVAGFCDAGMTVGTTINSIEMIARTLDDLTATVDPAGASVFVAIGNNARRQQVFEQAKKRGFATPPLIHPTAVISQSAEIGEGTVIAANCVVNANARVGKGCILNTACSIDHDNVLEEFVQICPGVHSAGTVYFGAGSFIGTGAAIIPGVTIGAGAVIAAGSVVTEDVPEGARIAGVPAKSLP